MRGIHGFLSRGAGNLTVCV